ncbi:tRNA pseudouridine(38-40) synthase TruA [Aquifex aeolicus]|uniref:tRNA pseudouridine synthase A n=1 Tax=Aquifex aeolicus (strain VF5) TaxID=224324 RepID=TRUA_AQUAE|nr:tRNA pseudouridine(38-40) synthase TruA [Aquifex aeolicus]O66953.1 RecName: Full=tRNA pseudouridine synthase A; AltName: Full=tRNA pseudouridine(38-40) synthase; AltName: Full=tRNA pseudouridylate synthase I; AltName: Full=tRNA-uridine isomerase I [Aquifex aeolicus VF5]AAC06908.1 pseudouridine synthase I [Aquifex aeolicus VF5]
MPNYLLRLAFVGTNFYGWQVQPNLRTVQGEIQKALSQILCEDVKVTGCCRTDSGVHALDYIANFKTQKDFPEEKLLKALNGILPKDVGVYAVKKVSEEFNARYSVKGKVYLYKIWNSEVRNPFLYPFSWQVKREINTEVLRNILKKFEGTHDFRALTKLEEERNTVINLEEVSLNVEYPLIEIRLKASHFLRYMVRRIVGTAVKISLGLYSEEVLEELLQGKGNSPYTAPPQGLHLEKVLL